jgi:hypothetical protein
LSAYLMSLTRFLGKNSEKACFGANKGTFVSRKRMIFANLG